ncbi:aldo-keto reductase family 1 member B1-like [Planococcus citri]|uniref:aldo-keto reductase family 1 member B1-like n=1 Tax=Planococcus citri TaxID=170843 RepID=UPI0031FA297D
MPAVSSVPLKKLTSGQTIPAIGLGTFAGSQLENTVSTALEIGYTLFDTAWVYRNEVDVGKVIRKKIEEGVIKREDVIIISKLWNTKHRPTEVLPAIKRSLADLGLDYIDMYLIHWPFACKPAANEYELLDFQEDDVRLEDTWKAMEELVRLGLTKSIGLSNFNSSQVQRILNIAEIKPVVNQVECNPYINQKKLIKFCNERNIEVIAYAPFWTPSSPWIDKNVPSVFSQPIVNDLALKYKKQPGQIILRYLTQLGAIPIPKSDHPERLRQNFEIFDFQLSAEDMSKMDELNMNKRSCPFEPARKFKEYPFGSEY